jgi:hypothetical protein
MLMTLRFTGAAYVVLPAVLLLSGASVMAECPSSQKPAQAYRVSVGNSSTSDIYRLNTGETRVVGHFRDGTISEQTFFQGLIRTEHIDRGRRTTYKPGRNLADFFPLKTGQTLLVDFDVVALDGQKKVLHAKYEVTGKDQIFIGPCRYDVVKVAHSNSFRDGPLQFINTDWYAPEIRLTVAREFKRANGEPEIRKYDSISVIEDGGVKAGR